MTTTFKAHFDGKTIVPDEAVALPVNRPLTLSVELAVEPSESITGAEIAASGLVGLWKDREDIGDSLEFARKLRKEGETRRHQIDDPP